MPSPSKDATAYSQTFSSQSLLTYHSPLRPSTSRTGGRCGRPTSSGERWGQCCSRFKLSMKPLRKRYHFQLNVFLLISLNSVSDSICFSCSRKMVRSPGTMMAPTSSFHRLPPWSFLAKTHLPLRKVSCGSSLVSMFYRLPTKGYTQGGKFR
jgi:hypothetical protein